MASPTTTEPAWNDALESSVAALRRVAGYNLDPALDHRILELGERKEMLTAAERSELLAWVAFTQQRSLERLEAERACAGFWPFAPNSAAPRECRVGVRPAYSRDPRRTSLRVLPPSHARPSSHIPGRSHHSTNCWRHRRTIQSRPGMPALQCP